ncbi:carboxylesterase family protein [Nocardia sp. NPDC051990]|uniref:carboxylesterase family protein n=1 Tax=Nocardia sp. NPDC051990 TaxID=3155285 RepID=UPI0034440D70
MTPPSVTRIGPIRYARAARFQRPAPVPVIEDDTAGQICPQAPQRLAAAMGPCAELPQGEDCLNLVVATPGCDHARRPVMVFLHGGAFGSGAGLMPWYDGTALAGDADVVVVSVNYRLGVFGYLCLDGVSEPNLGLYDQLEALRWVQVHIAAYGGDPDNVTVFGQSAGALSIRLLMEVPEAKGLFTRAILQSGPAAYLARPRDEAEEIGAVFARHLAADARTASVPALLAAAGETAAAMARSGAVSVPPFYPVHGAAPVAQLGATFADNVARLEVLCGWNADDASAFTGPGPRVQELTHQLFAEPITAFIDQLNRSGANARGYRFTWWPDGSQFGATHGIELPLLLGDQRAWQRAPMLGSASWDDIDQLGRQMRRAWGEFARTGTTPPPPPTLHWV